MYKMKSYCLKCRKVTEKHKSKLYKNEWNSS